MNPGDTVGRYRVQSRLGAGGMGIVYLAEDVALGRKVALKFLPAALAADPQFRNRFDREARTISALDHPHICTLYDVGEQDGTAYLVMQYLEGETLEARLKRGALPLEQALQFATQIADALDKAHRAGVVHRDLKPGNIMVTKSGAMLLDFGLAKATASASGSSLSVLPTTPPDLTAHGTILGTFQYMAPEQLEGRDADARTDIFSFGVTFYEMVTGRKAFAGASQASLIGAILKDEPPPIATVQPQATPSVEHVLRRCLAKDADDRWQSARDVLRELQWIKSGASQGAATPAAPAVAPSRRPSLSAAWGFIAGVVLAAALAMFYVTSGTVQPVVTRLDVVTPVTNDPFSFALSADGRQLAFVSSTPTGPQLWVRSLDQPTARPIAGTEGATQPFWSPDGRAIGFFAGGKLKRVDVASATVRVLADAPVPRGGSWNKSDVILFTPTVYTEVMRVSATGGTVSPVTKRPVAGQGTHRWPRFLPDGRQFVFLLALAPFETRGLYLATLDGGEPRRLMAADAAATYVEPGYLLLPSQGALVAYRFDPARGSVSGEPIVVAASVGVDAGGATGLGGFSASATGILAHRMGATSRRQLVWVDRSGKEQGTLGPPDESALAVPDLAPDGHTVAVMRNVQNNPDVWLIDVGRAAASRLTYEPVLDLNPVWSPDSRRVVFASNRKGRFDLVEKRADGGSDELPVLVNAQDKTAQDWSRDGRFLMFAAQDEKTGADLWALPMDGDGRKPFAVLQSSFDELHGRFSPDGRWIAYASNETGRLEVYVRAFPEAGGKRQVSTGGGFFPRWRQDGRELFYVAPDNSIMAVPVSEGPDARTLNPGSATALFRLPQLAVNGNNGLTNFLARAPYAVAADGRFLVIVSADESSAEPITMVLNWQAAMKK